MLMKFRSLLLVLYAMLLLTPGASAQRLKYDTMMSAGSQGPYGVSSGGVDSNGTGYIFSRPTRIGQDTMIGSSSAQTESSTVQSMPVTTFTPPSFSPQLPITHPSPALTEINIFSENMVGSPALQPTSVTLSGYGIRNRSTFQELPSPFSTGSELSRRSTARGSTFGRELINPLEGL